MLRALNDEKSKLWRDKYLAMYPRTYSWSVTIENLQISWEKDSIFWYFFFVVWTWNRRRETREQARDWRTTGKTEPEMAWVGWGVQEQGQQVRRGTKARRVQPRRADDGRMGEGVGNNYHHSGESNWFDYSHQALPEAQGNTDLHF